MTTSRGTLRGAPWFVLAPLVMLAMGCTSARSVIPTMPVDTPDADITDVGAGAVDAGHDGSGGGGVDAATKDTGTTCGANAHACGGQCVSNADVAHCAQSCSPCVAPKGGTATCDGTRCGFTCAGGYHPCGSQCLPNTDVASCGSSCSACATPVGGTATCDGATCGGTCPSGTKLCVGSCISSAQACLGSCPTGTHNCNGTCQSNPSPNSCGTTSCTPCSTPANGVATCDGTSCGFTCSVGYHLCGNACVANSGVASCGTSSCTACVPPSNGTATCDGLQCGFQCAMGFHACGNNCVSNTSLLTCGNSCAACPTPTTGTATCDGTSCGVNIPTSNVTVFASGVAGATGTVTPSPAGTSCGTGCFGFVPGTSVKLTAAPASGFLFAGWSGDCAGQGASCTLTLSSNLTAAAHFRPNKNIAFVSSGRIIPGTIGSNLAAADAFCASAAQTAFLGGTVWKAWLSTSTATTNINAPAHVGASTTGWIRVDGRPIATSMTNLLAGKMYYPIQLNETGVDPINLAATTGTNADGTPIANGTCGDWTSTTGMTYCGSSSATFAYWSYSYAEAGDSCGAPFPIYCFENDSGMAAVAAPVAPSNARHAFLSTTLWTPGGGVTTADSVCQGDASSAGLANATNYRALLTTSVAATDSSRISLTGQPWYRFDGAQLFASAADLADPAAQKILTPMNVTATGQYRSPSSNAWTGNLVAPVSTTMVDNCNNWTSNSASLLGVAGTPYDSWFTWWTDGYMPLEPCNTPDFLYCFER